MPDSSWLLGSVTVGALVYLTGLYAVHLRTRDAGIVDFGWVSGIGLAALFYALAADGHPGRRMLMAIIACMWSFRLANYLLRDRVIRGGEDARYANLRGHWGNRAALGFLAVFLVNGVLVALFSIPLWATATNPQPLGVLAFAGGLVGFLAIIGERTADSQLAAWKDNPENKGKTCRAGLWRYSRHPNYFFEWVHWWAYVLMAGVGWRMAVALIGPAVMLVFLYRVTGIPYTEMQAVKSRGDDYRAYQRTTSPFFPWFPRDETAA